MAWARSIFDAEERAFRNSLNRFVADEISPVQARLEAQGFVERRIWLKAGEAGMLGSAIPEAYGGAGAGRLFPFLVGEAIASTGFFYAGFAIQDIVAFYLLRYGSEWQKQRWLPDMCAGRKVAAIAMTEPTGGSDLKALLTAARRVDGGYMLNGSKTFITNGPTSDLVIVAARTDPDAGAKGVTLFVVETSAPGYTKGAPLKKLGQLAQDTGELFFQDVFVPERNRLGVEGSGFTALMSDLPFERLWLAVIATAAGQWALDTTVAYAKARRMFGSDLIQLQDPRFRLAEMKTELRIGQAFLDTCLDLYRSDDLDAETAAMAKYWCTELQGRVLDLCVQLHGGYGYMAEQPIARAYADARAQRIYGGSNEVMRELVARSL